MQRFDDTIAEFLSIYEGAICGHVLNADVSSYSEDLTVSTGEATVVLGEEKCDLSDVATDGDDSTGIEDDVEIVIIVIIIALSSSRVIGDVN